MPSEVTARCAHQTLAGATLILRLLLCANSRDGLANPEGLSSLLGVTNSVPLEVGGWGIISSPTPNPPTSSDPHMPLHTAVMDHPSLAHIRAPSGN